MRTIPTTTATLLALAAPGRAQDADGDGTVTRAEMQVTCPEVTAQVVAGMDTDGDGAFSGAELRAASDGGLLPP